MRSIRASRLRAVLATVAVVCSAATFFVVTPGAEPVVERTAAGVAAAADLASAAPALLVPSKLATTLFETKRPTRTRTFALDALLAAAALAFTFGCYARRSGAHQRHRQVVDAVFTPRRGPPHLAVKH
jgi:hypothetical protein